MLRTGISGIALALLFSASAHAGQADVHRSATATVPVPAAPQRIALQVTGLSCPLCAYGLEKKLKALEGVERVAIDLKTGQVVLDVGDGAALSDARLRNVVKEAGFAVTDIKRSTAGAAPSGKRTPGVPRSGASSGE
ncbi:MAG: heavy-metal-associated domain-containing protein [Gemmatimonadetes bacterium]|nr:heavy-metal-associated domain-containing protein [Gemmatimonadota bacterium]